MHGVSVIGEQTSLTNKRETGKYLKSFFSSHCSFLVLNVIYICVLYTFPTIFFVCKQYNLMRKSRKHFPSIILTTFTQSHCAQV